MTTIFPCIGRYIKLLMDMLMNIISVLFSNGVTRAMSKSSSVPFERSLERRIDNMPNVIASWRDVLRAAADHIEKFGLARGKFGRKYHPCCAIGAMRVVSFGKTDNFDSEDINSKYSKFNVYDQARHQLREFIISRFGMMGVPSWSDSSPQHTVIEIMREVSLLPEDPS
jgi:hypothetical protein